MLIEKLVLTMLIITNFILFWCYGIALLLLSFNLFGRVGY